MLAAAPRDQDRGPFSRRNTYPDKPRPDWILSDRLEMERTAGSHAHAWRARSRCRLIEGVAITAGAPAGIARLKPITTAIALPRTSAAWPSCLVSVRCHAS